MKFDLTSLNLVLAIEQAGSITHGAARENMALAAASKRLSDLESRIGAPLFVRRARGVEPTDAGAAMVRHVRAMRATFIAIESDMGRFSLGLKGNLRIGIGSEVIAESLAGTVAAFLHTYPDVNVVFENLDDADAVQRLRDRTIDVGILKLPQTQHGVRSWTYGSSQHGLLVGSKSPLASHLQVKFHDLLDQRFILRRSNDWLHAALQAQAELHGHIVQVRAIASEPNAMARLVENGAGVAVVPATVGERLSLSHDTYFVPLCGDWARAEYSVCISSQWPLPVFAKRFLDDLSHRTDEPSQKPRRAVANADRLPTPPIAPIGH